MPVVHVGVNLQAGSDASTESFMDAYGLDIVGDDFDATSTWAVRNRFFPENGQPLFALINGVPNSPTYTQWELLDRHAGYGQTDFASEIEAWRQLIDSVEPGALPGPRLSAAALDGGAFSFTITGTPGVLVDVEGSTDLTEWTPLTTVTNASGTVTVTNADIGLVEMRYYRVRQ